RDWSSDVCSSDLGEELIVDNAEDGISEACKKTGAIVEDFTAGPVYFEENDAGAHEWIVELSKEPESRSEFVVSLDQALRKINSDYDAKRTNNLALKEPII